MPEVAPVTSTTLPAKRVGASMMVGVEARLARAIAMPPKKPAAAPNDAPPAARSQCRRGGLSRFFGSLMVVSPAGFHQHDINTDNINLVHDINTVNMSAR